MKNLQKDKLINKQTGQTELSVYARKDLEEIWSYINQDNSENADKLIREFLQKFKLLAGNPKLGKSKNKLFLNLRSFPFKTYVIFYVPNEIGIEIFRVVHTSTNIDELFENFFDNLK